MSLRGITATTVTRLTNRDFRHTPLSMRLLSALRNGDRCGRRSSVVMAGAAPPQLFDNGLARSKIETSPISVFLPALIGTFEGCIIGCLPPRIAGYTSCTMGHEMVTPA